ncbi:MAG TPA: iron-sulfur cluster-binding protein [Lachnospiraceae bacterium]|nr:iron-sulfur cluster-binding protein [Lachnospiraceae bacterium]
MNKNVIIKRYGDDPKEMTESLLEYAGLSDMLSDKDMCIGIKPNLVTASPADYGATTHPEIVEGIICYLHSHGYRNLVITEGSWVGDKTGDAYEICGYRALCEKYDVRFYDTQKDTFHGSDCAGMELNICDIVDGIDFMINVPVLKGHCQTRITCALKNMKGLIPNSEKRRFHTMGLHKPIAHLAMGIRQDLIVVDHICGDLDFEEGGNPVKADCVMVAADPVFVDAYACRLLGYDISEVPYIGLAESLGAGSTEPDGGRVTVINELGEVISSFDVTSPDPYETTFKPENRVLDVSYAIEDIDSCSACYGSFVGALYRLKEEGILSEDIGRISIGQGHRGRHGELGIGNCCRLFDAYIPGCPPKEEDIYRFVKDRLS